MTIYMFACTYCGLNWEESVVPYDDLPNCEKCNDNANLQYKKKTVANDSPFGYPITQVDTNEE